MKQAIKLIMLLLIFGLFFSPVVAKNFNDLEQAPTQSSGIMDWEIPEADGVYNVPGRSDLKVRVFVHKTKAKPAPTPTPTIQCLADPDSTAVVEQAGWQLPANFTYTLNSSSVPATVGSAKLATIVDNAFSAWTNAIPGKVNITKTLSETTVSRAVFDGQNIVAWGRTSGSALGVTYIWYNSSGVATEVDTIMNKKFTWYWADPNADPNQTLACAYGGVYDAQDILTHEIGHWYGLDDHYTDAYTDNTMYGYGSKGEAKKNTLTTGDAVGVQAIY